MLCKRSVPLFAITLLTTVAARAVESKARLPDASLGQIEWLAGSWAGRQGDTYTEEHWIEPKGGLMLGVNRTIRESGKTSFEFLRIAETGEGIVYHASPGGRKLTPFRLTKLGENS